MGVSISLLVFSFLICSAGCAPQSPATETNQRDLARPIVTSPPVDSSGLFERQSLNQTSCGGGISCFDQKICTTYGSNVGCCRIGAGSACTIHTTCSGLSLSIVNGVMQTIGLLPATKPVPSALICSGTEPWCITKSWNTATAYFCSNQRPPATSSASGSTTQYETTIRHSSAVPTQFSTSTVATSGITKPSTKSENGDTTFYYIMPPSPAPSSPAPSSPAPTKGITTLYGSSLTTIIQPSRTPTITTSGSTIIEPSVSTVTAISTTTTSETESTTSPAPGSGIVQDLTREQQIGVSTGCASVALMFISSIIYCACWPMRKRRSPPSPNDAGSLETPKPYEEYRQQQMARVTEIHPNDQVSSLGTYTQGSSDASLNTPTPHHGMMGARVSTM